MKEALKVIDFTSVEQNDLFAIVASILHVGNIDFKIANGGVGLVDTKDVEIVTKVQDPSLYNFMVLSVHVRVEYSSNEI